MKSLKKVTGKAPQTSAPQRELPSSSRCSFANLLGDGDVDDQEAKYILEAAEVLPLGQDGSQLKIRKNSEKHCKSSSKKKPAGKLPLAKASLKAKATCAEDDEETPGKVSQMAVGGSQSSKAKKGSAKSVAKAGAKITAKAKAEPGSPMWRQTILGAVSEASSRMTRSLRRMTRTRRGLERCASRR